MNLLFLALLLAGGDPPAQMDPAVIPNYALFRPGLAVAGKPSGRPVSRSSRTWASRR